MLMLLYEISSHRPDIILATYAGLHRSKKHLFQAQLPEVYSRWICNMKSLCFDLVAQTSTTITEWDGFEQRCRHIFPKGTLSPLNTSIGQTINNIRVLTDRLHSMIAELERDQTTVSLPLKLIIVPVSPGTALLTDNAHVAELPPGD